MSAEYTPNTYRVSIAATEPGSQITDSEFARWLVARDAAVEARALRDAADGLDQMLTREAGLPIHVRRDPALWLHGRANDIETGEGA